MTGPAPTEARERRLWIAAAVVALLILATVPLVRPLGETLGELGLLAPAFGLGFLLVIATILTHGLTVRPGAAELILLPGIVAVFLFVAVRVELAAERTHLIEYGVLAVLVHRALVERAGRGVRVLPHPAPLAILVASGVGAADEGLQAVVPGRVFDPVDLLFNTLAATMAVAATVVLAVARRFVAARRTSGR